MSDLDARTTLAGNVRTGAAWSALSSLALRAGSFSVGIVLARLLTPDEFGVYAVALTVQAILMTVADFGLSAELIRSDQPERRAPTVATLGVVFGTLLAVGMALMANPMAALLGSPDSANVIVILSLTLLLGGVGVVPYATLQRNFHQRALFGVAAIDFLISTAITITLVIAGWGVMSLAVGRIVAQVSSVVLQFMLSGVRPRFGVDWEIAASVLRFGVPVGMANALSWALLNIDNVVIARYAGPLALGFYVLAFNVSSWPMSAIGQAVRSVALPAFARISDRRGDLSLASGFAVAWALALPAGVGLVAVAGPLIEFVYGPKWAPSIPILAALGLFGALRVVFDLMVAYLLARGASTSVLWIQGLWFITLVPAMILGTRWFGAAGGGWAHLVVSTLLILPAYLVAVHRSGADIRSIVVVAWPPLLAAIPAGTGAYFLARTFENPAIALVAGAAAGTGIYGTLLGRWLVRVARDALRTPRAAELAHRS